MATKKYFLYCLKAGHFMQVTVEAIKYCLKALNVSVTHEYLQSVLKELTILKGIAQQGRPQFDTNYIVFFNGV